MTGKKHSIPNFEIRSALLLAAFAVGTAAAQAQVPASPASPNSPPSRTAPSGNLAQAIPQNKTTSRDLEAAFNRADTNRDGKLNHQEAEHFPAVAQRFELIDADRDTFISREEFSKAAGD